MAERMTLGCRDSVATKKTVAARVVVGSVTSMNDGGGVVQKGDKDQYQDQEEDR